MILSYNDMLQMTKKDNLLANLEKAVLQEEVRIRDKFSKADSYLGGEKRKKTAFKVSLVREGISLPSSEAEVIEEIRRKIVAPGFYPTKSELFRAGIHVLARMSPEEIIAVLKDLPKLKPGRKQAEE